jgi:hypothetical protein
LNASTSSLDVLSLSDLVPFRNFEKSISGKEVEECLIDRSISFISLGRKVQKYKGIEGQPRAAVKRQIIDVPSAFEDPFTLLNVASHPRNSFARAQGTGVGVNG